ncbi:hypothetical protein EIP91_005211 [Steccherinum ochraceum]|uniref:ClpP/crotonase n=1 Tax=Steccherinum ochraceum TaxID=92696 RepID=A0A4R0R7S2_9APHY|nr:hypothetical protein EIP91_005211 [Steccherinum ochraceum]
MSFPLKFPADAPLLTITHPKPALWVLEMHNGDDNRLTHHFIQKGLLPALDAVERDWRRNVKPGPPTKDHRGKEGGRGALIIVGKRSQQKFFSNGLDFDNLMKQHNNRVDFIPGLIGAYNPLLRRLLTYPLPVIAALNGHTFAAGMIMALCCDYRVMVDGKTRNAWMTMNEIHFGATLPPTFPALFRTKYPDGHLHRKVFLEGHRFTPSEALEAGLVDHIVSGNTDAVLAKAEELASSLEHLAQLGGYGVMKYEMYRPILELSLKDLHITNIVADDEAAKARL